MIVGMKKGIELTVEQVATRLGVGESSVRLWCKNGRFANARRDESNPRGIVWYIPVSDLRGFKKQGRGRPRKKGSKS